MKKLKIVLGLYFSCFSTREKLFKLQALTYAEQVVVMSRKLYKI